MKLYLESFETISYLAVYHYVGIEEARILNAGILRLQKLDRPWLIVEFNKAILDEMAINYLSQQNALPSLDVSKECSNQVVWVGEFSSFCQYEGLTDLIDNPKFKDLRNFSAKIDLQVNSNDLQALLKARESVSKMLTNESRSIPEIENEYILLNRALRASHTSLINRLMDPAFSELQIEEKASSKLLDEIRAEFGKFVKSGAKSSQEHSIEASKLYEPQPLKQTSDELKKQVIELQQQLKKMGFDSKGDRLVSLVLENQSITDRINEVRDVWLYKLQQDLHCTVQDFENGYRPILDEMKAKKEKETQL